MTGGVISRIIFVAFFSLDVLIEVTSLTSTELIHQSSAWIMDSLVQSRQNIMRNVAQYSP